MEITTEKKLQKYFEFNLEFGWSFIYLCTRFSAWFFGWITKEKQNDTFFENIENKKLGKYKNTTLSIKKLPLNFDNLNETEL